MKKHCIMIEFKKDWNFKFTELTQSLPSDLEYDYKLYYPQNGEKSSIRILESLNGLVYLLYIDESKIKVDQMESFLQKFKETSKPEELNSQNALFIVLLIIFSRSQFYNDSLFYSFIEYFSQKKSIQFGGYINKQIHDYIITDKANDMINQSSTYYLSYYTLFYCFFMNGSDFIKTNFAKKLPQQENANLFTNLIQLFDKKFFYFNYPDRFREALILTSIFYMKSGGKFSMKQLDEKEDTLKKIRSKVVEHENDEYLNEFFNRLISLLEIQQDIDIWSCFFNILKRVLPTKYWNYFIDQIFLQSPYFHLRFELTSRIIIEHDLINQFILKRPCFFNDIFNLIISDNDYCKRFDKKVFQNYYKTFGSSSFHELLLTNQGKDNFDDFKITNRLKYFDILTCLLKLSEMTFEQFIDSKNEEEIKVLTDFCNILKKQKFVDYSDTGDKIIKDAFDSIINHKFSKITKDFNEDRAYIIKIIKDTKNILGNDVEYKIYENGIFNQMNKLGETIKKLMELFIDDGEYDTFVERAKNIKKLFDHPDSLPLEISYSEMIGYKSKTEENIIDIKKYLSENIKLNKSSDDVLNNKTISDDDNDEDIIVQKIINTKKHDNIKKNEPNDNSSSNDESSDVENIAAKKLASSNQKSNKNRKNKSKIIKKSDKTKKQPNKTNAKDDKRKPVDKEKNETPPQTEEEEKIESSTKLKEEKDIKIEEEEEEKEEVEPEKRKTESKNQVEKDIKIEEEEEEKEEVEPEKRKAENTNQANKDIKIEEEEEEKEKVKQSAEIKPTDKKEEEEKQEVQNAPKKKKTTRPTKATKTTKKKLTKKKSQIQTEIKNDDKSDNNSDDTNDDTKDSQKGNDSSDQEDKHKKKNKEDKEDKEDNDDDKNTDSTSEGESQQKKKTSRGRGRGRGKRQRRGGSTRGKKGSTRESEQKEEDSGGDDSQDEGDENE